MQPACADDGAAQEGNTFGGSTGSGGGNRQRRTDGGQNRHDELNDVLDSFFLFHNFTCCV